jgi:nicotinamide-nucleotide amidase
MTMPAVELIAIGDELLLGETADTNSRWLAARLAAEGIAVARATVVGDDPAAIRAALEPALRRCGVVLCTGGLGPTADDLTREAVAQLFGRRLVLDNDWLDVLRARHARRGLAMADSNRVQAELPEGALLLPNARGTAPGIAVEGGLGLAILLPGVPSEMRALVEQQVLPLLRRRLRPPAAIQSRIVRTAGVSEAMLADRLADIARDIAASGEPVRLAFLPHGTGVDLRLTFAPGHGLDSHGVARRLQELVGRLCQRLGDDVYALDAADLAAVAGRMLRERALTIAVAESCTGGLLAKRLTDEAGASAFVLAGLVTYSNTAKQAMLGVREETIAAHGAVSEACAGEMALGARAAAGADMAIAVTGIAGPGGGTADKPVGTVWIAVALADGAIRARRFIFAGDRVEVRERATQTALDMLRRALLAAPALAS